MINTNYGLAGNILDSYNDEEKEEEEEEEEGRGTVFAEPVGLWTICRSGARN